MSSYQSLCTRVYDFTKPYPPEEAFKFYLDQIGRTEGPVLEGMCGSGRFLVPLAELGYDIEGIDCSPQMLEACRKRLAGAGKRAILHETTLDRFGPTRQFGLVMIPAGSFSLVVDQAAIEESLRRIYASLLPGGTFIVEVSQVVHRESFDWPWGGTWFDFPSGEKILLSWVGRYDSGCRTAFNVHRYELIKDGRLLETEFEDFNLRHYEIEEFSALIDSVGFISITPSKLFEDVPAGTDDDTVMFKCRRPSE